MSKEKEMHKTGWTNIELPPHLKNARGQQEREILKKKKEESSDKDLKFTTAEEDMNQEFKDYTELRFELLAQNIITNILHDLALQVSCWINPLWIIVIILAFCSSLCHIGFIRLST